MHTFRMKKIYNPDFEQTKYANYKTKILYGICIFNKVYTNRENSNFKDIYVKC